MQRYKVDDVDQVLLRALRDDGRASYGTLASLVDLSSDAVRARIARLSADGVARIIGVVHPSSLGYEAIGTAWFTVPTGMEAFAAILRGYPNVTYLVESLGVPNVLAEIAGADDMELATTVQQILDQRPDVRLTDFWRSIEFFKWQSQGRPELAAPPLDERPSLYSESDVPLLRLLVDNPRASYRELAEELGEPYWNVRRRTKALFDSGAIRATAMVDRLSTQAGSSGAVAINIVGAVEDALHRIAAIPHVNIVSWQTGAFNAMAEFQCDSRGELLALSTAIAAVEGVTAVETRLFVKTHIAATPWLLEGSVRA